ncbi:peptidylprolyl isomerase [Tateyamaria sp. ANG-S1]|uniref:peptidylprolyl isomerase n=1 Tax=Tateyamaria sp. ANG-S1 TaxID=1577905 RepID=UPI00057EEFD4|nr:peptidylprolyl isomerase [Tateyamaria sp. ANG-S1]KIC49832.1 peptidylprolyl isomerase [Tateyamaria sp. ANG-S1]
MNKRFFSLPALGLIAALATPATAQDADTVVATVNGTDITVGHMIVARASLPQQFQQLPNDVLFSGILEQLINQTLLAQSFDGDLPKRTLLQIENETRSLTAGEELETLFQEKLTDEAIQAAYEAKYEGVTPQEEYNASHILVETEEEAKAIKAELDGGADFAATAREKSTGPSGPNGGQLGWFGAGAMVPSFEAAVISLEVGEVSDPVQTQFGWHVIILNETRVPDAPKLDDVREELLAEVRDAAVEEYVASLTANAQIDQSGAADLDPEILSDLGLVE